ncbi:MAG: CBS domain-containing protein [Butyricicoccaceae bacterium]
MNISFFLKPKAMTTYIYANDTIRQGMEKMYHYGYTAIPVLTEDERYLGTITEGDFLWTVLDFHHPMPKMHDLESRHISEIPLRWNYESVHINATMEELYHRSIAQNFIPVVDDRDKFIGIITRQDIIKYFAKANDISLEQD